MNEPAGSRTPGAQNRSLGPPLVIVAAMLWGTSGTARALGPSANPAAVGAVRLIIGSSLLLAFSLRRATWRHSVAASLRCANRARWLVCAAAAAAGYQAAFFSAIARTGVVLGTVVAVGSAPIFTGLVQALVHRERPPRRWFCATAIALTGTLTLLWPSRTGGADALGITFALCAGLCYGLYTNAVKELLSRGMAIMPVIGLSLASAALLMAPVVPFNPPVWLAEPKGLLMAAWLGIAATAGAYLLFAAALTQLAASAAGTLGLAEPLTAVALGVLVLNERPTARGATGAALTVIGLLALALPARPLARRRWIDPSVATRHGKAPP